MFAVVAASLSSGFVELVATSRSTPKIPDPVVACVSVNVVNLTIAPRSSAPSMDNAAILTVVRAAFDGYTQPVLAIRTTHIHRSSDLSIRVFTVKASC